MKFNMQAEKNIQVKQDSENLFRDNYGILRLAAHATLTKAPASSKIPDYLRLKWTQWVNSILAVIKQLWQSNTITCSDFIWLEPDIFTYKMIDESCAKTSKKSGISLHRGSMKINGRRRLKERIAKK